MAFLPTSLGTRPRLAVEIRPEGVVAARSEDAAALVSAVAYGVFDVGCVVPGLKAGNIVRRPEAVAAVRKALDAVALKERQTSLILPDASVRVLLLDFDALPAKLTEALPVVRFRLKKLLPFDADEAVVSYQVMSSARGLIRVLAVAVPREVLAEYESIVREAGFEPGAVLPSTLAACAGLAEDTSATLLVNAGETGVTTAIIQDGVLLLHRSVDLAAEGLEEAVPVAPAPIPQIPNELLAAPLPEIIYPEYREPIALVDLDATHAEWTMQQPVKGYGVLDEADVNADVEQDRIAAAAALQASILADFDLEEAQARQQGQMPDADAPVPREDMLPPLPTPIEFEARRLTQAAREVTQAVSVAAAYFEDTLQIAPGKVAAAGTLGASALDILLREAGFGDAELHVREMVDPAMLIAGALTTRVPHGWIAGVRGALRS